MSIRNIANRRIFNIPLILCLSSSSSGIAGAAEVMPDGSTNTTVDAAPNDVPVVNFAVPNVDGVFRNTYSDYNVDPQGLILNNANDFGVSQ